MSIVDVGDSAPFYFTPVYRKTEAWLREAALPHATLRCNLYAEFVRDHYLRPAAEHGALDAPFGDGRVAPVARADAATALASLVQRPDLIQSRFSPSGPRALNGSELANIAARA